MAAEPDLEALANELGAVEEEYSIDQIMPSLYSKFLSHSKKGADGKYKTKFTEGESEEIADDLFEQLSYHIHINVYGISEGKWKELQDTKGPSGESYADTAVEKYFGIDRETFRDMLKKETKLDQEVIGKLMQRHIRHHMQAIQKPILDKYQLKPEHASYLKQFTLGKIKEYHLDPELAEALDKAETLEDVMPHYQAVAKSHYKKGHGEDVELDKAA
jgi:hypothetical protein